MLAGQALSSKNLGPLRDLLDFIKCDQKQVIRTK